MFKFNCNVLCIKELKLNMYYSIVNAMASLFLMAIEITLKIMQLYHAIIITLYVHILVTTTHLPLYI